MPGLLRQRVLPLIYNEFTREFLKVESWDHCYLVSVFVALVRISRILPFTLYADETAVCCCTQTFSMHMSLFTGPALAAADCSKCNNWTCVRKIFRNKRPFREDIQYVVKRLKIFFFWDFTWESSAVSPPMSKRSLLKLHVHLFWIAMAMHCTGIAQSLHIPDTEVWKSLLIVDFLPTSGVYWTSLNTRWLAHWHILMNKNILGVILIGLSSFWTLKDGIQNLQSSDVGQSLARRLEISVWLF